VADNFEDWAHIFLWVNLNFKSVIFPVGRIMNDI